MSALEPRQVVTTVGTDHHPFDRLVQWMARWHDEHQQEATGVVQHGTSVAPRLPRGARADAFVPYDELVAALGTADAVVSHGGPATIVDARTAGILPIVVPRRHDRGEHVDDHQVRFANRMAQLGQVLLVETYDELCVALEKALLDPEAYRLDSAHQDVTQRAVDAFADEVASLAPSTRGSSSRRGGFTAVLVLLQDLLAVVATRRARA